VYKLLLHEDAKHDLLELRQTDRAAAQRIMAFLEQLKGDQDLLDRMTQDHYGQRGSRALFHIRKWVVQWRLNRNLLRFKLWDLEEQDVHYRVIYAFVPKQMHYCILGIAPKSWNYQAGDYTNRMLKAYDELAL
jgi:hypothetical protein